MNGNLIEEINRLRKERKAVILAHNHASGIAIPSEEDKLATRQVKKALDLIGVDLADHIIVAGEDFVSLADSGML